MPHDTDCRTHPIHYATPEETALWHAEHQANPDRLVVVGESIIGGDEQKSKVTTVRYADWDGRCKECYP